MNSNQSLEAAAANHSTDVLVGALLLLDAKGNLSNEERMVQAATSDVITERHNLAAAMDEVFFEDLDFAGTHTDALLICLAQVAA